MCDAFELETSQSATPLQAAEAIFARTPQWVHALMSLRNSIVRPFGLIGSPRQLPATRQRLGMFPVLAVEQDHVVLGLDDRHLDFRIVLEVAERGSGASTITLATNVKCHNTLGRVYLAVVRPFHRIIVPAMLGRLAAAIWSGVIRQAEIIDRSAVKVERSLSPVHSAAELVAACRRQTRMEWSGGLLPKEKVGPGVTLMSCANACEARRVAFHCGGRHSQANGAPVSHNEGRVRRTLRGICAAVPPTRRRRVTAGFRQCRSLSSIAPSRLSSPVTRAPAVRCCRLSRSPCRAGLQQSQPQARRQRL